MTTIHQVNLSDDAFILLAALFGQWQGVELSDPENPFHCFTEERGARVYATFRILQEQRFGQDLERFTKAFGELAEQLAPREGIRDHGES